MKKKEHEEKGIPPEDKFYLWDYRYYDRKYIEESLSLDDTLVKEYFPVSVVVPTILSIYQNLLGVRFEELKNASIWHPGQWDFVLRHSYDLMVILVDVQAFAVWNKDATDESGFVGYCYLDLFPRSGYQLPSLVTQPHTLAPQLPNIPMLLSGPFFQVMIRRMALVTILSQLW